VSGVWPQAVKCLDDRDHDVRIAAAGCLCSWERTEGIPVLLSEGKSWDVLNAVRQSAAWKRLKTVSSEKSAGTSHWEKVERALEAAGMPLKWDVAPTPTVRRMLASAWNSTEPSGARALPDRLSTTLFPAFALVVEDQQLRVLGRRAARKFWETWWEGRKADVPKRHSGEKHD
jgi:hypothetical protein